MDSSAAPRLTAAARGTGLWFVASGNKLRGPFSFEELVIELDSNRVSPGDFCWRQGFQEWRPVCSVEEFGISRDRPTLLSPYPSVPLPSTGRVGRRSTDRKNNPLSYANSISGKGVSEERRIVRLRVQKNAKSTVTWLERFGFFISAVIFAYASVWVVTSEVEKNFEKLMNVRRFGSLEHIGHSPSGVAPIPYFTAAPVLSSPGFAGLDAGAEVEFSGILEISGVQSYSVGGNRIQGPRNFFDWSPKKQGYDSVYIRQVHVQGQLNSSHPGIVRFLNEGEPYEFVKRNRSYYLLPF